MDILYKTGTDKKFLELSADTVKDIALSELIEYMANDGEDKKILRDIMTKLPLDPLDMIYRQEIVRDLVNNDGLRSSIEAAMDPIKVLKFYSEGSRRMRDKDNTLLTLLEQLRELKVYVEVVESLYAALSANDIKSEGLLSLRENLSTIVENEDFKTVKPDIIKIHDDLSNVRGAVLGVTFTPDLDIENVTSIEFTDYKPRSNYTIMDVAMATQASSLFSRNKYIDPLMVSMTPYVKKHLSKHIGEVKRLITKHSKYDSRILTDLYNGFVFYLKVSGLGKKLASENYAIAYPEIVSDRPLSVKGLYNIRLAVSGQQNIVKNDFAFSEQEKIYILTGPNRGGKTILEQALGLISVMASLGMFVTADSCTGLPFKNILTHFPIDENLTINYGRLGEEAVRIRSIVSSSDRDTLILCNETFSTTSAMDALYLSKDFIRILKERGSAVIFNTHIHELAADIPEMNQWEGSSDIISIVMEIKDNQNTFRLKRSTPEFCSYARNIAEKYGITYEQMREIDGK